MGLKHPLIALLFCGRRRLPQLLLVPGVEEAVVVSGVVWFPVPLGPSQIAATLY
jgi:hypothetical protein